MRRTVRWPALETVNNEAVEQLWGSVRPNLALEVGLGALELVRHQLRRQPTREFGSELPQNVLPVLSHVDTTYLLDFTHHPCWTRRGRTHLTND